MRCRAAPDSAEFVELYWGGWVVRLNSTEFSLPVSDVVIIFRGINGEVGRQVTQGFPLPANEDIIVIPREVIEGRALSANGAEIQQISFQVSNQFLEPQRVDHSFDNVHLELRVLEHSLLPNEYPTHTVTLEVSNSSNYGVGALAVFGLVYNSREELVDVLVGAPVTSQVPLMPHSRIEVNVFSLSRSGRCVGKHDPLGYHADIWVEYFVGKTGAASKLEYQVKADKLLRVVLP
jgi:hypothetical protein